MTVDRQRLTELARAATPGPWTVNGYLIDTIRASAWTTADAAYIAAASPDVILDLLQRVADLEAALLEIAKWDCLDFDEGDCFSHGDDTRCAICVARAALVSGTAGKTH